MSKQIFASLSSNIQVKIFDEESKYFTEISKSFNFDIKKYKKVDFKENLNSNLDEDEIYFVNLTEKEEMQFFEDIKLKLDSVDNNLIKKEEYKEVKTIYLLDSNSKILILKKILPTERIKSKNFIIFNDTPEFRKESNKISMSSRIDIFYNIAEKKIYFFNFNTLKAVFGEAITFYREASKEEAKNFFIEDKFEIEETIFDNTTTKFKRKLGLLIDSKINFNDEKLMKKYENYAKKWKIKLEKEDNKYILKKDSQLKDFVKVFGEVFYKTPISEEGREADNFRIISKNPKNKNAPN
jgi:hypothetical protein